jgi:hypothetical protein
VGFLGAGQRPVPAQLADVHVADDQHGGPLGDARINSSAGQLLRFEVRAEKRT